MKTGLIASRYAQALYEFASDYKMEDEIYKGMKILEKSFTLNRELNAVLRNPLLKRELKKQLIITAYGGEV
ncbi:MAG TPA: F0F1 ATP synthase subunit delta, partial [Paludibacteraceae bacterium]|nr:F0F1 ATP synthase subunit delta [Paludibacteraceae bacterium]